MILRRFFLLPPGFKVVFLIFALLISLFLPASKKSLASDHPSLDYIYSFQDEATGGMKEEMNDEPQQLQTDWAIMAFSSAGYDPDTVIKGDKSLVDFAKNDICSLVSATDIERKILALESAGIDTQNIEGCDLYAKLADYIDYDSGQIGDNAVSTIFGILALSAQNQIIPNTSIDYLVSAQQTNGGWDSGWGTESNITAQAIMALETVGYSGNAISKARDYLDSLQISSGGIKYDSGEWSTESDAFSNAFTLGAIYALDESAGSEFWSYNGVSIPDDLAINLKNPDGSYSYNKSLGPLTPVWTTSVVEIALNQKFLPVKKSAFIPYIIKQTSTPTPTVISTPSPVTSPTVAPISIQAASPSPTASPVPTASVIAATTPSSVKRSLLSSQSDIQPPETTLTHNEPQLALMVPTNNNLKGSLLDWRWIVAILIMAFLSGILIRHLQYKYINENK
jgi:hypothetical protein